MVYLPEPMVRGCPVRAFPAEVKSISFGTRELALQGDADALWLEADEEDEEWQGVDLEALRAEINRLRIYGFDLCRLMAEANVAANQVRRILSRLCHMRTDPAR